LLAASLIYGADFLPESQMGRRCEHRGEGVAVPPWDPGSWWLAHVFTLCVASRSRPSPASAPSRLQAQPAVQPSGTFLAYGLCASASPIAERAREPDIEFLPTPRSKLLRALCLLATRTALPCHGAELCTSFLTSQRNPRPAIPSSDDDLPSLARVPSASGEVLPHLGRRFRVLLPSESAPFQLLLPTKWIRAVSWPPHALTLVCVFEEGRGGQGDTAGIETGEAVRASTTGKQQRLSSLTSAATPGSLAASEAQGRGWFLHPLPTILAIRNSWHFCSEVLLWWLF